MARTDIASLEAQLRAATSPDAVEGLLATAGLDDASKDEIASLVARLATEAIQTRADLRAAVRAREILLASAAHDLRNPLNTFAMSSGLLRDDLESPDFDRTRALSLVARMDRASTRMQGLIEDLLEASRVEAGAIELKRKPELVGEVVRAAIARGKPLAADKGASVVEAEIAEATLDIDRGRTADALVKLIAVALKTVGDGGSIRLGAEVRADTVAFIVSSVPQRGPPTTAHDESRGGLALLIARGLFAAQGGTLATETVADGPRTVVTFPKP